MSFCTQLWFNLTVILNYAQTKLSTLLKCATNIKIFFGFMGNFIKKSSFVQLKTLLVKLPNKKLKIILGFKNCPKWKARIERNWAHKSWRIFHQDLSKLEDPKTVIIRNVISRVLFIWDSFKIVNNCNLIFMKSYIIIVWSNF
jgi:hypothetical protein